MSTRHKLFSKLFLRMVVRRSNMPGSTDPRALGVQSASEVGIAVFASMSSPAALGVESVSEIGIAALASSFTPAATGVESASEIGAAVFMGMSAPTAIGVESASEVGTASPPSADTTAPVMTSDSYDEGTTTFSATITETESLPVTMHVLVGDTEPTTADDIINGTGLLKTTYTVTAGANSEELEFSTVTAGTHWLGVLPVDAVGNSAFAQAHVVQYTFPGGYVATGVESTSEIGTASLLGVTAPAATGVESTSEVGSAAVSNVSAPAATGVESASDIGDAYVLDTMGLIRQDMESRVDPFIGTSTGEAPGIAVGFVGEGSDEFSFGRGLKSIGGPVVDGDTLFCLGSVTKTLTGYAFAKAKVDGDLGWATLANTWLDSTPDDIRIHASIDLRMLASHTSGLPSFPNNMGDDLTEPDLTQQPGKNYTKAKWATDIAAGGSDPLYTPGSNQSYSNLGFAALSIVMQNKFSYADDDELLDTKVFTPLGMTKTSSKTTTFLTTNADDLAQGYESDLTEAPFPDMGILAGAGEFISSANDMMIFVRELAERSSSYSQEMEVDISGPQAAIGYGHGIGTTSDGEDLRTKGGSTAAYTCAIAWRENPNLGVVVLTNRGGLTTIVQLAEDLLDDAVARLAVQMPVGVESASEVGTASVSSISAPAATGVESTSEVGTATAPSGGGASGNFTFTLTGHDDMGLTGGDPATLTPSTSLVEGNIIVVVAGERSGGDPANFTISDTNSGVWTKAVGIDNTVGGNETNTRATMNAWVRKVGSSEGTPTITVDDGTSSSKWAHLAEITPSAAYGGVYKDSVAVGSGASDAASLSTGSVSVTGDDILAINCAMTRNGTVSSPTVAGTTSTHDDAKSGFDAGYNQMFNYISIATTSIAEGSLSASATLDTSGDDEGMFALILLGDS